MKILIRWTTEEVVKQQQSHRPTATWLQQHTVAAQRRGKVTRRRLWLRGPIKIHIWIETRYFSLLYYVYTSTLSKCARVDRSARLRLQGRSSDIERSVMCMAVVHELVLARVALARSITISTRLYNYTH
jgi:hypothetical protein